VIELSVVVPVYHEGEAARGVITEVAKRLRATGHEILVVYDEPDDPTVPVIEDIRRTHPEVRGVLNRLGRGPALALRAGFQAARGEAVVVTMADASDDPDDIPKMLAKLREGYDVVSGSRYMRGGRQIGGPRLKGLLSRLAGRSLRLFGGLGTCDATTAFKMYRKAVLDGLEIESRLGFDISLEVVVKASLAGYRVTEVPTVWRDRREGESKFRLLRWLPHYLRWYGLALTRGRLGARNRAVRAAL
jgi:glycosyltransferase involved in cell wall biosynthesis